MVPTVTAAITWNLQAAAIAVPTAQNQLRTFVRFGYISHALARALVLRQQKRWDSVKVGAVIRR